MLPVFSDRVSYGEAQPVEPCGIDLPAVFPRIVTEKLVHLRFSPLSSGFLPSEPMFSRSARISFFVMAFEAVCCRFIVRSASGVGIERRVEPATA